MKPRTCPMCGELFEVTKYSKKRRYCSDRCRKRAQRKRVASFVLDVKQETEEPAPIRSLAEVVDLIHAEGEMMDHYAKVVEASVESIVADAELIVEAERTGRPAWRYMTPEEEETRAALDAFRAFDPGTVWCAWEE